MRPPFLALLLLAGCGDIPRDPERTLETVRSTGVIRIGQVAGAEAGDTKVAHQILRRLSIDTGAKPTIISGTLEPLLLQLEAGQFDLVVAGRFDEKSPWATRVTLGPPYNRRTEGHGVITASYVVARNGENKWITLVQRQTRKEVSGR